MVTNKVDMITSNQQTAPVVTKIDPIKRDGVLKEMVKSENEAKEKWGKKWSFMSDFYKYCVEEAAKEGFTEEEYRNLRTSKKQQSELQLHGWEFVPSEKFPITSSGRIGWRNSRQECTLEICGPLYESDRHTMSLPDRPPTPPQKFIFLG